jgi:hypothetical protein
MNVIARRHRLNLAKPRMLEPACENDMAIQPLWLGRHLREGHAHLKSNARFLWQNPDWANAPNGCHDIVKKSTNLRGLMAEMMLEVVSSARMRLIAVGKPSTALRTLR